jgi:hypothetical protein
LESRNETTGDAGAIQLERWRLLVDLLVAFPLKTDSLNDLRKTFGTSLSTLHGHVAGF